VNLRAFWDRLLGRSPKPAAPEGGTYTEPSFPSQRTLTEEEQAERDREDSPDYDDDRPGPPSYTT
jgi:hypothetical protein